ncbi:methyltransferase family protein [Gallaecimonas sp. GXIMD1310]|uniref:methyltransferase family protein n=1 Tax=Gallaecimonas sp. GXIMD1310 TaxID=3131926 RepID=UPI00324DA710
MTNPGVKFPPPLIFVVLFAAGLTLDHFFPAPLRPLAWVLVVAGLVVGGWALLTCWRAGTPVLPHKSAACLVKKGPFRFSRNPMYLSLSAIYLGLALWLQSLFAILLLPLALYLVWLLVIRREEAHLQHVFGEDYRHYCAKVRRWF